MTRGNPTRLLIRLAVPLILANLGQQLYGIVDAIIVGQGVGVDAFAALGACDWLVWLVLWSVQGLTQGFSALISQAFGAADMGKTRRVIGSCVRLCLIIGLTVTVASMLAARPLLRLLNTPERILPDATLYLRMIYGGTLIVIGYNMAAATLRAIGDGRTALVAMLVAGFANIGLDLLFVMGLGWGIAGAASATLLAQLLALGYCLIIVFRSPLLKLSKADLEWDRPIAAELCRLGLPLAFSSAIVDIGGIFAQSVVNAYGYVFVAGCTAANKLHGALDCSAVALGFASSTFIGQNYGAGRMDRVRTGIRRALVIALALGGAITAAMLLFGRQVVGLFLSADAESAAEALETAHQYVIVMSAMLTGAYLMNLYRYSLQGLGNSTAPMLSGFFELGARVFVALVFPCFMGRNGLFFMDGAAWWAAGLFQMICFYRALHRRGVAYVS